MKTPEEMAEVYINNLAIYESEYPLARSCFIAGYKAAQEQQEKEWGALVSKGRIAMQTLNDQLADADKVINGDTSDGYHTFNELYEHRYVLFMALIFSLKNQGRTWMAKLHQDGTCVDNYFIAGIMLPTGTVSYHLPDRLWTRCVATGCKVLDQAPKWDGHTSNDVINRLNRYCVGLIDEIQPPFISAPDRINSPENPDSCDHILDATKMVDVNGWVSVKDRLPEDASDVLIAWADGVSEACFCDDRWCRDGRMLRSVTHWMPLPEPPKEDK
jgi:hypothetical protein